MGLHVTHVGHTDAVLQLSIDEQGWHRCAWFVGIMGWVMVHC